MAKDARKDSGGETKDGRGKYVYLDERMQKSWIGRVVRFFQFLNDLLR